MIRHFFPARPFRREVFCAKLVDSPNLTFRGVGGGELICR